MGMVYRTREGPCGVAADTWYLLATLGSDTTPGPLLVPGGKSKIKQVIVSFGNSTQTAAEFGYTYLVKLDGPGLTDGEQSFSPGSWCSPFTTAGEVGAPIGPLRFDVDINVKSGGQINIYGAVSAGVTNGTPEMAVTLGFA
jgi:hypothetical protein